MPTFTAVWSEIQKLLPQGLSIIPVRDKDEKDRPAKTPYQGWKEYQNRQITEQELYDQLEKHNTSAIAILGGKISGNLEIIDIDVKHHPGIDALLFDAIRSLYPNLWHVIRIHRSPSGGYHLLYKVHGEVPGNKKLAGRPTTQKEKDQYASLFPDKKKPLNEVNFLETRGEGGYALAPPSMGYSVFKDCDIPTISWEERCSLINVCQSFTLIPPKQQQQPKQPKQSEDYYDENPFEHYNKSDDALQLLYNNGWTFINRRDTKIWLTKPGGKRGHVHGAYFTDSNLFYVFTTATDFNSETSYRPSAILCELACNGDWKECYKYLVNAGYGRIKQKIEHDLIKKGRELPANASKEAVELKQQHDEQETKIHPYGIFWEWDEANILHVSRERLYVISEQLGFRLHNGDVVRLQKPFVYEQTERQYFDAIKHYISEDDADVYEDICNCYESFLQKSGRFTISRLPDLDQSLIQEDTRLLCNKFFTNCYLEINKDAITVNQYTQLDKYVFYNRIQQREYALYDGGVYPQFLHHAFGELTPTIIQTIGYLAHEYKDETTGYIIVLTEKVADPKKGGGSGKNLFCSLFSNTTTFISRPGAGAKFDERFFQSWNGQRIFAISDVDEKFDFLFLKEPATGNILWKKLFKDETSIPAKHSPKLIVNTNYSYEVSDGGLARRIKPIEFTDYFTVNGGVDAVFDKHFTDDWTKEDWNGYDTFIAKSVQEWLKSNRKLQTQDLSATGWEKQFRQTHKQTVWELIQEYWLSWLKRKDVPNDLFKSQLKDYYSQEGIHDRFQPSMKNIHRAIQDYAAKHRVIVEINISMRQLDGMEGKGKRFSTRSEIEDFDLF